MAKDLPYFRFTVQEWQNGKISLESYQLQGLFISVCGYYWINEGKVTLSMLEKRFPGDSELMKSLLELGIMKHERRHDKVEIDFLSRQLCELNEIRKARQEAGSRGGKAKAKRKQKSSYKDKDKDKDNNVLPSKVSYTDLPESNLRDILELTGATYTVSEYEKDITSLRPFAVLYILMKKRGSKEKGYELFQELKDHEKLNAYQKAKQYEETELRYIPHVERFIKNNDFSE